MCSFFVGSCLTAIAKRKFHLCPILGPAGRLNSVKARSGAPAKLWSRESQEPGSSYLGAAEKEQVRELLRDGGDSVVQEGHPASLLADT